MIAACLATCLVFIYGHSFRLGSYPVQDAVKLNTGSQSQMLPDILYHDNAQIVRISF